MIACMFHFPDIVLCAIISYFHSILIINNYAVISDVLSSFCFHINIVCFFLHFSKSVFSYFNIMIFFYYLSNITNKFHNFHICDNYFCLNYFCCESTIILKGLSWPWSYGSWIYNYLYNQCLSPLMLWVRISMRARCTTFCDKVCQWLVTGRWFCPGPPVSSTNKTDRHDITEILLKVALNTIKQTTLYWNDNLSFVAMEMLR
jgi:hypothetical protein